MCCPLYSTSMKEAIDVVERGLICSRPAKLLTRVPIASGAGPSFRRKRRAHLVESQSSLELASRKLPFGSGLIDRFGADC